MNCDLCQLMLVGVTDYQTHTGQGCDLIGCPLRVAAGDYNSCVGILSLDATDGCTGVLVGSGGYGAGIKDNDGCVGDAGNAGEPLVFELAFEGGAVGLSSAASEVFYKESRHTLW